MIESSMLSRWALLLILIIGSMLPQAATVFALGSTNVLFLAMLWIIGIWCFARMQRLGCVVVAAALALLMAIPPVPNYLGVSKSRGIFWNPISPDRIFGEASSLGFFVFYLAIFLAASMLIVPRKERPKRFT